MEQILEQFGVQPVLLLAQIVNFLVLLFILNKLLYKPVIKLLEQRKQKIEESIKNAEKIELKLQKTEEESALRLEKASDEAKLIIEESRKSASEIISEAHLKAQSDMTDIMNKGMEQIAAEKEKMQEEMRDEMAGVVEVALKKVIEDTLSQKDQKEIMQKAVKSMKV